MGRLPRQERAAELQHEPAAIARKGRILYCQRDEGAHISKSLLAHSSPCCRSRPPYVLLTPPYCLPLHPTSLPLLSPAGCSLRRPRIHTYMHAYAPAPSLNAAAPCLAEPVRGRHRLGLWAEGLHLRPTRLDTDTDADTDTDTDTCYACTSHYGG